MLPEALLRPYRSSCFLGCVYVLVVLPCCDYSLICGGSMLLIVFVMRCLDLRPFCLLRSCGCSFAGASVDLVSSPVLPSFRFVVCVLLLSCYRLFSPLVLLFLMHVHFEHVRAWALITFRAWTKLLRNQGANRSRDHGRFDVVHVVGICSR